MFAISKQNTFISICCMYFVFLSLRQVKDSFSYHPNIRARNRHMIGSYINPLLNPTLPPFCRMLLLQVNRIFSKKQRFALLVLFSRRILETPLFLPIFTNIRSITLFRVLFVMNFVVYKLGTSQFDYSAPYLVKWKIVYLHLA